MAANTEAAVEGSEIVFTRVFDAPRALVFDAWTDAEKIAQWWGPAGFTTTTQKMDVRPGGVWRFVMHGPDGRDYQNRIVYEEVARPKRLVYAHGGAEDVEPVNFRVTVTFDEDGGKTRLTMRMVFPSAEERERVAREYGAVEGGRQTLARLAHYVAGEGAGERVAAGDPAGHELVITRIFDAPRALVWKAWTERERMVQWWGPKGFTVPSFQMDMRPGGAYRVCMRGPDGADHWVQGVLREIVPQERLVYTWVWEDAEGNPGRETLTTVSFADRGNKTELTLRHALFETESARDSHRGGWSECLDRLADHLAAG